MDTDHAGAPVPESSTTAHDASQEPVAGDSLVEFTGEDNGERDAADEDVSRRYWRTEMARWLLTLNPGRTQDEYAKAIRYFFETDGVPQDLDEVSADLLLAYRGALAMRAERGRPARATRHAASPSSARLGRLWGRESASGALPGDAADQSARPSHHTSSLAPATVNIRLTALRQFLRFASMRQPIAGLTPERAQMALRRLPIERRRPYQILSEEEWPAFLAVARLPLEQAGPRAGGAAQAAAAPQSVPGPWGRTRAERERAQRDTALRADTRSMDGGGVETLAEDDVSRARDGRTGARTALRDYALVALALATGLRAIELSLLDLGDLTRERRHGHDEWWLTLPDEKTKGQRGGRTLPLAPDLVTTLLDYARATGRSLATPSDRATPLFLALPRGPRTSASADAAGAEDHVTWRRLRPEQIRSVINRVETQWITHQDKSAESLRQSAEARRISPHALRHSAAIALLKGSESAGRPPASVEHVRGWLGHFDIRTTQRYLDHLNSRDERRRFTIAPTKFLSPSAETDAPGDSEAGEH